MGRRELLAKLGWGAGVVALPLAIEAEAQREAKPVTPESLASSVMRLGDKARSAGLVNEANALRACALAILQGGKRAMIPCDTDTDCERKNGR